MEHRIVFQRNQYRCNAYTDLDSTHYHTAIKGAPKGSKTHVAPLKFGVFYPIKSIR